MTQADSHLHLDSNHHRDELLLQLLEDHQLLQGQAAQPAKGTDGLSSDRALRRLLMFQEGPKPQQPQPQLDRRLSDPSTSVTHGDWPSRLPGALAQARPDWEPPSGSLHVGGTHQHPQAVGPSAPPQRVSLW